MKIYFIGGAFTDAGGWWIGSDGKIHRIPGWNPEAMVEVSHAINVIREAGQLKTPGLAEATIQDVLDFVQKELAANVKENSVVVLG